MNTVQVSDVALDRPPGGFLDTWAWTFLGPQLFGIQASLRDKQGVNGQCSGDQADA